MIQHKIQRIKNECIGLAILLLVWPSVKMTLWLCWTHPMSFNLFKATVLISVGSVWLSFLAGIGSQVLDICLAVKDLIHTVQSLEEREITTDTVSKNAVEIPEITDKRRLVIQRQSFF